MFRNNWLLGRGWIIIESKKFFQEIKKRLAWPITKTQGCETRLTHSSSELSVVRSLVVERRAIIRFNRWTRGVIMGNRANFPSARWSLILPLLVWRDLGIWCLKSFRMEQYSWVLIPFAKWLSRCCIVGITLYSIYDWKTVPVSE